VFNQSSADAYNVVTYGTPETAYNNCVFNCAGQSMLISGSDDDDVYNTVTVNGCDFNASAAVDGKAAIELDSSDTAGIKLVVDGTDVTGFADGSVSGEDLWNNKMGQSAVENNDITVIVDGVTVLQPLTFVAKIGSVYYASVVDALNAVQDGETIELLGAALDEHKKEIEFTRDIAFTITGSAPQYCFPVVTFQNATVNIVDAEFQTPELDARRNATINVVDSKLADCGGNSIVNGFRSASDLLADSATKIRKYCNQ